MGLNITYGEGGFCENCEESHEHPLYNIIEQVEVDEPEPSVQEIARESARNKLRALGLDDEEIKALIG